jgi:hypothetical protein
MHNQGKNEFSTAIKSSFNSQQTLELRNISENINVT